MKVWLLATVVVNTRPKPNKHYKPPPSHTSLPQATQASPKAWGRVVMFPAHWRRGYVTSHQLLSAAALICSRAMCVAQRPV